jgi:cysteinyl-tRNA synthetase
MSLEHIGEQVDIHGGGNDLIFPHHENEIAQTESYTGKPFVRYWMHNGMMQLSGEAMSKSTGNMVTVEEFLAENDADVLRIMVLNSSYRSPLTYNDDVVEQSTKALERLSSGLRPAFPEASGLPEDEKIALGEQVEATRKGFTESMDDDFNTASALGHLFDLVRVINHARDNSATAEELADAQSTLREFTNVFGLRIGKDDRKQAEVSPFVDLLLEVRKQLREEKLWTLSDQIRDQLNELGVVLEDSKEGTTWRWE